MKVSALFVLLFFFCALCRLHYVLRGWGTRFDPLDQFVKAKRSKGVYFSPNDIKISNVYVGRQDGLKDADKINALPGQPDGLNFNKFSGYVTVDPGAWRLESSLLLFLLSQGRILTLNLLYCGLSEVLFFSVTPNICK